MSLVDTYHLGIETIIHWSSASDKMLHQTIGLALYVASCAVWGGRRGSRYGLAIILAAETVNELMDWAYYGQVNWPDLAGDYFATMFWPVALALVARLPPLRSTAMSGRRSTGSSRRSGSNMPDRRYRRA